MSGKIVGIFVIVCALLAGGALYYLQIYGFYYEVAAQPGRDVTLIVQETGEPEAISYSDFQAIDADSSPIRYRACFQTDLSPDALRARSQAGTGNDPRVAPAWFDCFDALAIGAAVAGGDAQVFLSQKNVGFGVDRVVAITAAGRGYIWHEFNNCGEKAYDGTIVGEECPQHPAN